MDKKELIKEKIIKNKSTNGEIEASIEKSIFFEETNNFNNKEEVLSTLRDCIRSTRTITRLCNTALDELEKSSPNYEAVLVYVDELGIYSNELDSYISKYKLIVTKDPMRLRLMP